MATVKTFRLNGQLSYDDLDNNIDNLNNDKIERVVDVNDSDVGVRINQSGTGMAFEVGEDLKIDSQGNIVYNKETAEVTIDLSERTDGIALPSGTDAQQVDVDGVLRYNTEKKSFEGYTGVWNSIYRPLHIERMSECGYNNIQVFGDGEIYVASANTSSRATYTNGKTGNVVFAPGLDNFDRVIIPDTSPVVDAGSAGGYAVSYALCENGNLYTWGLNSQGQCGVGNTTQVVTPTLAQTNVTKVFTHPTNGANLLANVRLIIQKTDGYLYGAGYNNYGALGLGTTTAVTTFTQLTAFGTNPKSVWNLGGQYGCLIVQTSSGSLLVSGYNGYGQLGNGNTTNISTPVDVTNNWINNTTYTVKNISGFFGYYNTSNSTSYSYSGIIVHSDNETNSIVKTCGRNSGNFLGDGTADSTSISTPVSLSFESGVKVREMTCIGEMTCSVLLENNNLWAWGYNPSGQVGNGTVSSQPTPVLVQTNVSYLPLKGLTTYRGIGSATNYIVKTDGHLYATGYNSHGQVGNGTTTNALVYTRVLIPTTINNKIRAMSMFSTSDNVSTILAVREDNEIFGWGYNSRNGVWSGNTSHVITPKNFKINRV